jgi:hypothetical protein
VISWMYSSRLVRAHTDQFLLRFKKPNLIRPEHKKWESVRAPKKWKIADLLERSSLPSGGWTTNRPSTGNAFSSIENPGPPCAGRPVADFGRAFYSAHCMPQPSPAQGRSEASLHNSAPVPLANQQE